MESLSKKPGIKKTLGAVTLLLLSTVAQAKESQPKEQPVPIPPQDVREQGGDAVLEWMFKNNLVDPNDIRLFFKDKAAEVTNGKEDKEFNTKYEVLLAQLRISYEALPDTINVFKTGGKLTWENLVRLLTPDILAKVNKLENPRIYGVNDNGELLIGDGGPEVPVKTRGKNYQQTRNEVQKEGLSLLKETEYKDFAADGSMEAKDSETWLDKGENPDLAPRGLWSAGVVIKKVAQVVTDGIVGARRVLRIRLFVSPQSAS